jgi:hypothetical protein
MILSGQEISRTARIGENEFSSRPARRRKLETRRRRKTLVLAADVLAKMSAPGKFEKVS